MCFVTIIQVKVISGHQVKRSNKKNRDLELRYMFLDLDLDLTFAENF